MNHDLTKQMKFSLPILSVITVCFLVVVMACTKGTAVDDDLHTINDNDTLAPVLTIHTPIADQQFSNGNTITITGRITDESGLYRGSVKLINDANGETLKQQAYEIHGVKDYSFTVSHTAVVTAVSNYTVVVNFEDHGLNNVNRSVRIKVNP